MDHTGYFCEASLNTCSWCKRTARIVFEPDGDRLCKPCADAWVRGEGDAAQERGEVMWDEM